MLKLVTEKARILVVEDEGLVAQEIIERLDLVGYQVVGEEVTAEGAIATAKRLAPDLILMDIRLKGAMDGISAARWIREEVDVPVVYLTAHSDRATLQRAKTTLPFGYVLKPFQENDLVVTIEMALQRHEFERRLRESEARYATTLKSIGDGVIATDAGRRVTFMNPAAETLTGWPFGKAEGQPVEEVMRLIGEQKPTRADHPIEQAISGRAVVHLDDAISLIDRQGGTVPIEDSAAPIMSSTGEVLGAVMAFRDCRERRRSQEALREAEERLQAALRMEAIGRLAAGVAHDFNNMLTVILGCCDQLGRTIPPGGVEAKLVRTMLDAGGRASALTDQLLAFGQRRLLEPRVVELNGLVRGIEGLIARILEAEIRLEIEASPELLYAKVDPGQLEQALVNLAANARDAMAADGGSVTLKLSALEVSEDAPAMTSLAPGRYVVIHVHDTGLGMDAETRDRIFEPFYTTKAGRGTGLGLATVYSTIRQSNGFLEVASSEGEGTTFAIYLPRTEPGDAPLPTPAVQPRQCYGTETILLVEDSRAVRKVACEGLRSFGYTVRMANDGPEAFQAFDEQVDLLVTDMMLPGWNGRQVAERLVRKKDDLKVLFISGSTQDVGLARGLLEDGVHFLRKPFTITELARKVREVLDR